MIEFNGTVRFLAERGPVTAARRWSVPSGAAAGALGTQEARAILRQLRREESRPELLALYELATGLEVYMPSQFQSDQLLTAIEAAFEARSVLLFRGWGAPAMRAPEKAGGRAAGVGDVEALTRELMGERRELAFEGRRYRMVPAAAMDGRREVDGFRAMSARDARQTLDRMAARFAAGPEVREQWTRAVALLESPRDGDRIVLLRFIPTGLGSRPADAAPAATPSQVRAQLEPEVWIEIEIVYEDGSPFDRSCLLELPGGRITDGAPDEDGLVRVDGLASGTCKLSFPDLDAQAFDLG